MLFRSCHFVTSPLHDFATLPLRPASSLAHEQEQPAPALSIVLGRHRVAVRNAATGEAAVFEDADRGRVSLEGRGLDEIDARVREDPMHERACGFLRQAAALEIGEDAVAELQAVGLSPARAAERTDERLARADDTGAGDHEPTPPAGLIRMIAEAIGEQALNIAQILGRPGQRDRDRGAVGLPHCRGGAGPVEQRRRLRAPVRGEEVAQTSVVLRGVGGRGVGGRRDQAEARGEDVGNG